MTPTELAIIDITEIQDPLQLRELRPAVNGSVDECFLCGRGLTPAGVERASWVHLAGGGSVIVAAGLGQVEADMGYFPVGSECAKRVPRDFRHSEVGA